MIIDYGKFQLKMSIVENFKSQVMEINSIEFTIHTICH